MADRRALGFGAAYGYAGMGPYRGAQAERLRVPYADANCIPVPGEPGNELEDDLVLLADAFVTGWHATELARVFASSTVASSVLQGCRRGLCFDRVPGRLDKAGQLGAIAIDYRQADPVDQIRELRRARGLPIGEQAMSGGMPQSNIDSPRRMCDGDVRSASQPSQVQVSTSRPVGRGGRRRGPACCCAP